MTRFIIRIHSTLLATTMVLGILTLALVLAALAQRLHDGDTDQRMFEIVIYAAIQMLCVALLCHPAMRFRPIIAPDRLWDIPVIIGFGLLCLAPMVEVYMEGFRALLPLSISVGLSWPYVLLFGASAIGLMTLFGIFCAISTRFFPHPLAAKDHFPTQLSMFARAMQNLTVLTALTIATVIVCSVLLRGAPTTGVTVINVTALLPCAYLINRRPVARADQPWLSRAYHNLPAFIAAMILLFVFQRVIRAFLYHTGLFELSIIDEMYEGATIIAMLPPILFILSTFAALSARIDRASDPILTNEVFR